MVDFLVVVLTMMGLVYVGWFIHWNDGDGNTRPDKTLMAMREDPSPPTRRSAGRSGPSGRPGPPAAPR